MFSVDERSSFIDLVYYLYLFRVVKMVFLLNGEIFYVIFEVLVEREVMVWNV